ncbi:MAG TPA: SpoIIE family protein phosphatase [Flavobacteriales bacterium]|nr:SpoIIE family protein phosphatase [Flavobacteriales bacterium]
MPKVFSFAAVMMTNTYKGWFYSTKCIQVCICMFISFLPFTVKAQEVSLNEIVFSKKLSQVEKKKALIEFNENIEDTVLVKVLAQCDAIEKSGKVPKNFSGYIKLTRSVCLRKQRKTVEAMTLLESIKAGNDLFLQARVDYGKARNFIMLADYDKALKLYFKVLDYYIKAEPDKKQQIPILNGIANCYRRANLLNECTRYTSKSITLARELGDTARLYEAHSSLALLFIEQKKYKSADSVYSYMLGLLPYLPKKSPVPFYNNYADVKIKLRQFEEGEAYLKKCYERAVLERDTFWIGVSKIGQGSFALLKHDIKQAIKQCEQGMHAFIKYPSLNWKKKGCDCLYEAYKAEGDHKTALRYFIESARLEDSISTEKVREDMARQSMQHEFRIKEAQVKTEAENERKQLELKVEADTRQQRIILYGVLICFAVMGIFSFFLYKSSRRNKQAHKTISQQKKLVDEKQKEIVDSINYAKRLQHAIMPPAEAFKEHFPENFLLYLPKDIVAGDFYFIEKVNELMVVVVADCTGHGVPGAMVSIVCSNALHRAIKEYNLVNAGAILDKTRELVMETFSKSESYVRDGMDISLCVINTKTNEIEWAGANSPLWYLSEGQIHEIKPDKQPVGAVESPKPFSSHVLKLKPQEQLYLFTDGYCDQFGGEKGKKFMHKRLKELLISIAREPMHVQREHIHKALEQWRGGLEQVDDVCVLGIRF